VFVDATIKCSTITTIETMIQSNIKLMCTFECIPIQATPFITITTTTGLHNSLNWLRQLIDPSPVQRQLLNAWRLFKYFWFVRTLLISDIVSFSNWLPVLIDIRMINVWAARVDHYFLVFNDSWFFLEICFNFIKCRLFSFICSCVC